MISFYVMVMVPLSSINNKRFYGNFTLCTTGQTNLGNLLQGGEAFVKFFANFLPFPATVSSAPETKIEQHDNTTNKNYSNALFNRIQSL